MGVEDRLIDVLFGLLTTFGGGSDIGGFGSFGYLRVFVGDVGFR